MFNTEKPSWALKDMPAEEWLAKITPKERLVDITAYCLNPNHFHLLLKELQKNGLPLFMKKISTGYAMYFNKKNERSGILFQGRFKSTHIDNNDLLLYISSYINCNSEVHNIEKAENYQWCSFSEYINENKKGICQKEVILNQFKGKEEYKQFCLDKVVGMKEKKEDERSNYEN